MNYLLSTGQSTNKIEYYIIDLFRLYLHIWPNDIPGADQIGFDFIFNNTKKKDIISDIKSRINTLIVKIKGKFSQKIEITLISLELLDETKVKLIISVNQIQSDEILVDISENN